MKLMTKLTHLQGASNAPAGLAMLQRVDGLFVEQEWEVLETMTLGCYEGYNKYKVYDRSGKVQLFSVKENTTCCYRQTCGEHRPFTMNIFDETGKNKQKMMVLKRGYACCGWAVCPCCIHSLKAHYVVDAEGKEIHHTGSDTLIATVRVPWGGNCFTPQLILDDREGKTMGWINGPLCCVTDCCGADFTIFDNEGKTMGNLKKLKAGTATDVYMEMTTDSDKFRMTFPETLDPTLKMAILASLFQLDFQFFEDERGFREAHCCDCYICGWSMACFPKCCVCSCCCYATKEEREKAEKAKHKGAPQDNGMDR